MEKELSLIIDIGNSTTVFGLFDKEEYVAHVVTLTHGDNEGIRKEKFQHFLSDFEDCKIAKGMIFSVVPSMNKKIAKLVKKLLHFNIGIFDWKNYVYSKKDPRITDNIGADLLADLVGADKLYSHPQMIFDLGTINKLLITNKDGIFFGASFNPGMEISLNLFANKTALLPNVEKAEKIPETTGLNTIESMRHGIYWSTVAYVNHEHEAQEKLMGQPIKLILTGGNSNIVKDDIKDKEFDPLLTLKGMNYMFLEEK